MPLPSPEDLAAILDLEGGREHLSLAPSPPAPAPRHNLALTFQREQTCHSEELVCFVFLGRRQAKWGITGLTSTGTFQVEVEGVSGSGGSSEQEDAGRGPEPAPSRQLRGVGDCSECKGGPPSTEGMRGIWGFS